MSRGPSRVPDTPPTPTVSDVGEVLVMAGDIARMFGKTRQAVDLWTKQAGFPQPVDTTAGGRVWRTADVLAWAEKTGRKLRA